MQRVPVNDSRLHTSAATVAVLPEPQEVDFKLEQRDLKFDVFRASGAGGQHVNTTESAVRCVRLGVWVWGGVQVCEFALLPSVSLAIYIHVCTYTHTTIARAG